MMKDEGRGFAPPRSWRIAVAGAVFLAVVVLDQLSKLIVRALVSAHGGAWYEGCDSGGGTGNPNQ